MKALWFVILAGSVVVGCNKQEATASTESNDPPPATGGGPTTQSGLATLKVPDVTYSTAQADIDKGKEVFTAKGCNGCHKIGGGKLVGPDLKGVTGRRDKEWIAKMILRPDLMVKEDPTAKDLFKTYLTPMPNQGVPEADLPALMSYLKSNE
jgi:mono/diheme cytochrome c family protein